MAISLLGIHHGALIAVVEHFCLIVLAVLPTGSYGMDDIFCLQLKTGRNCSVAGSTYTDGIACSLKFFGSCSCKNCSTYTTAVLQLIVGCVNNSVIGHFSDVFFLDC